MVSAQRVSQLLRRSDQAARIGGDEFVVMLGGVQQQSDAGEVVQKLIQALQQPVVINDEVQGEISVQISASIGIAFCPDHGTDLEQLIKAADSAMYRVKRTGKGHYAYAVKS